MIPRDPILYDPLAQSARILRSGLDCVSQERSPGPKPRRPRPANKSYDRATARLLHVRLRANKEAQSTETHNDLKRKPTAAMTLMFHERGSNELDIIQFKGANSSSDGHEQEDKRQQCSRPGDSRAEGEGRQQGEDTGGRNGDRKGRGTGRKKGLRAQGAGGSAGETRASEVGRASGEKASETAQNGRCDAPKSPSPHSELKRLARGGGKCQLLVDVGRSAGPVTRLEWV